MKSILLVLSAAAMLIIVPNQAKADVIYDTFGSTPPGYATGTGWTIGTSNNIDQEQGDAFTPTANYQLTSVQLAAGLVNGPNDINVMIMSSKNNQPNSLLLTMSFNNEMGTFSQVNTLLTANTLPPIDLEAGTQYWIVAQAPDPTTDAVWNDGSVTGLHTRSLDNGNTWTTFDGAPQGAFLIDGTIIPGANGNPVVPEPASIFLLATGLAGVFLRQRLA